MLRFLNQIWSARTHLRKIWLSHAHLCCRHSLFTFKRGRGLWCCAQTRTRWPRPLRPERSVSLGILIKLGISRVQKNYSIFWREIYARREKLWFRQFVKYCPLPSASGNISQTSGKLYTNSDWHRGQWWGLVPEVAGILPKCERYAGNIPTNEGNKPHHWPMTPVWNSLPDDLRDPTVNSVQFRRNLKTYLFAWHLNR